MKLFRLTNRWCDTSTRDGSPWRCFPPSPWKHHHKEGHMTNTMVTIYSIYTFCLLVLWTSEPEPEQNLPETCSAGHCVGSTGAETQTEPRQPTWTELTVSAANVAVTLQSHRRQLCRSGSGSGSGLGLGSGSGSGLGLGLVSRNNHHNRHYRHDRPNHPEPPEEP